jgi:hypothetical protein
MDYLLTNLTGLDMALCLALLLVYLWNMPKTEDRANGLDTTAPD